MSGPLTFTRGAGPRRLALVALFLLGSVGADSGSPASEISTPGTSVIQEILDRTALESSRARIHLGGADYTFVHVPVRNDYTIGLTAEQRVDPFLLEQGFSDPSTAPSRGPVELPLLHPFLIQDTEVTLGQYWEFLRASSDSAVEIPAALLVYHAQLGDEQPEPLPPDLDQLPVTEVSPRGAGAYVDWLQRKLEDQAPGWRVRLPHELEWEMAARGDDRRFAFPDADADDALDSLEVADRRPVRSRPFDKTALGIWDMSGSVSELTASPYDPDLLMSLEVALSAGQFDGWDPRYPRATLVVSPTSAIDGGADPARVSMRGGANGEPLAVLQVSVRRSQGWSERDESTGFRLVLVQEAP